MWAIAFGVGGLVFGLGGLIFSLRRERRETADRRKRIQVEGQHEGEMLSDFVVRQTQAVLQGWEGVNRELQERAEAVVAELRDCTAEREGLKAANEELRQRVNSLETKVAALQREIADLRSNAS